MTLAKRWRFAWPIAAILACGPVYGQDYPSAEILQRQAESRPEALRVPELATAPTKAAQPRSARIAPVQQPMQEGNEVGPFHLLGSSVEPGSAVRLNWVSGGGFLGDAQSVPVLVRHGVQPGPVLCLTSAIHGDELNGIEVVRRVMTSVDPKELSGTLIGVPIVNVSGFMRGSRYLPDRRDLNRFFPGSARGSSASRIAYSFFTQVVDRCTHLVDFHTGSFERSNLPQVRGDLRIPQIQEFMRGFGATTVLHSAGATGMMRRAATERGIAAVTFEIGAPIRLEPEEIAHGVRAIETLLDRLGMVERVRVWKESQPFFYDSRWVRTATGGMLFSDVKLGDRVTAGQTLGRVINPVDNDEYVMTAPFPGRVIGLALNQMVMPGFAIFHVGGETTQAQAVREARRHNDDEQQVDSENMDEAADDGMGESAVRGDSGNERGE